MKRFLVVFTFVLIGLFFVHLQRSSKSIEGTWSVEYVSGLEDVFDNVEAEFLAKDEKMLWDPKVSGLFKISYDYKLFTNETWIVFHGVNRSPTIWKGNINRGINTLEFKDGLPTTLLAGGSGVLMPSGEIIGKGPSPIDVAAAHYRALDIEKLDVSKDGKTLTHYDVSNNANARFSRVEAVQ